MTNTKPNYNQNQYPVDPETNLEQNQDLYDPDRADTNQNAYNQNHVSYDRVLKTDKQMGSENRATGLLVGIGALSVAALVVGTMFLPGLLKQKENEPGAIPSQTESNTTESNTTIIENPVVIPGSETEDTSGINTLGGSESLPVENESPIKIPVESLSQPGDINGYTTTPTNPAVDNPIQSAPTSDREGNSNNFESSTGETTQEYPSVEDSTTSSPTLSPSGSEFNNNYDASPAEGGTSLENPATISPDSSQLESNPDYTTGGENTPEYPSTYDSTTISPESSPLESNPNNFDFNGEVTLPGDQTTGDRDTYNESEQ